MNYGLFDTTMLESVEDDDLINLSVFDENEVDTGIFALNVDPITESVSNDLLDEPITEGDEFASDSPADPEKHFNSDNSGNKSISVPSDATLDEDTYNKAIDMLQKSFKEGVEILDLMRNKSNLGSDDIMSEYI